MRRAKANAIIASGRGFAATVFNVDPEFVAQRNRRSRNTNFTDAPASMARLWSDALSG